MKLFFTSILKKDLWTDFAYSFILAILAVLQDFVVIKYSPKKKMVLTDHQKEMMKEKR